MDYKYYAKSNPIETIKEHTDKLLENLEILKKEYGESFVIADIPGVIEGASEGIGLGTQFLRHIERTRLLLHVIDVSGSEGRNPVEDFYTINNELKKYSQKLSERKQIIVANKIDSMQDESLYKNLEKLAKEKGLEIFKISAATNTGIKELIIHVSQVLKTLPKENLIEISNEEKLYTLEDEEPFTITMDGKTYVVNGPAVEKLMKRVNLNDNESMYYFHKTLDELGVSQRLKEMGIKDGDSVTIAGWELEWED